MSPICPNVVFNVATYYATQHPLLKIYSFLQFDYGHVSSDMLLLTWKMTSQTHSHHFENVYF